MIRPDADDLVEGDRVWRVDGNLLAVDRNPDLRHLPAAGATVAVSIHIAEVISEVMLASLVET